MRDRCLTFQLRTACSLALIVTLGLILSWGVWSAPIRWTPDALFYEAQSHEITGTNAAAARENVFFGPVGGSIKHGAERINNPRWVAYAAPFFRRRWVTPIAAAAIRPAFGERSLLAVSVIGYLLCGLGAFALLRRRFGETVGLIAAIAVLAFQPLRTWSAYPLSDSLGVAALFASAYTGCRAQTGSRWRIAFWIGGVGFLAFTRDAAAIPAFAAAAFALMDRSRRSFVVAATGALTALAAAVLFGAPLRSTMAFTFSENKIPADASWSFVIHQYGHFARSMILTDFPVLDCLPLVAASVGAIALLALPPASARACRLRRRVVAGLVVAIGLDLVLYDHLQIYGEPLSAGVILLICLLPLFIRARSDDVLVRFARAGAVGAIAYLFVLPQYTELRLGLVLIPFAAVGVARSVAWWIALSPAMTPTLGREAARDTSGDHKARRIRFPEPPQGVLPTHLV